jgi:hypothetical protein
MKTIGFFGDSYCADYENEHTKKYGYDAYTKQIADSLGLEIVHFGVKGSSIWDTYLLQLKPFIDASVIPDVTVITWTTNGKLFNRHHRHIHLVSSFFGDEVDNDIKDAANKFYKYLYDQEKDILEYISFLQYLDNNIFSKWPEDKKVIHVWSFGSLTNPTAWHANITADKKPGLTFHHRWKNGAEIRPPMYGFSKNLFANSIEKMKLAINTQQLPNIKELPPIDHEEPNHIDDPKSNLVVANTIINVINNYKSSTLYSFVNLHLND